MTESEFDKYAEDYYNMLFSSVKKSGEAPEFFAEYKIADTFKVSQELHLVPNTIFDFGSGIGNSIPWFRKYFREAKLICSDVSAKSLEISKIRFPGKEEYCKINDSYINLPDESVDLVFSTCVFHHIPHEQHENWLKELVRILKPKGLLMIFEHNPFNPLTVATVKQCPFDINAKLVTANQLGRSIVIAGLNNFKISYRIFFPRALSVLRPIEKYLANVPLGAQYYLYSTK